MPRIPAKDPKDGGLVLRLIARFARRRYGALPEPLAVHAHNRRVLRAGLVTEMLAEKVATELPVNVRELAVYRTAVRLGCSWCIDFGTMLQKHEGLDIDRLKAIDDYADSPLYSPQERLALAYADAMTATPVTVTDEQVAELEAEFGREGVLELTYQIGLENMRARMNNALDITEQGFTSGEACRVPQVTQSGRVSG
ncbi:carboxymuconolactone decarboxylase family protein [Amycolatopsis sp. 195334CR]|uniref:carboxymuconolactone decarboxylase family protein n=1 Tax=Amycolatopsis sp. 195334CR TaxID=2814588 RepID=UPI001A8F4FE4|nr:carboxymuconolactone decarboxylase family protein [Amycolatopsis sp. 195334CR]MBN6037589.1 carboxymuconolactone decarboxylase family protein [Amycolatopsis sp. 195334CR]